MSKQLVKRLAKVFIENWKDDDAVKFVAANWWDGESYGFKTKTEVKEFLKDDVAKSDRHTWHIYEVKRVEL